MTIDVDLMSLDVDLMSFRNVYLSAIWCGLLLSFDVFISFLDVYLMSFGIVTHNVNLE